MIEAKKPEAIRDMVLDLAKRFESLPREPATARASKYSETERARGRLLWPYRGYIKPEAFERIVRGQLDSEAWKATVTWLGLVRARRARFLWLCGGSGRAKTSAAFGALVELGGGRFLKAEEAVRAYRNETDEAVELRWQIERARVLIIDDIGTADHRGLEAKALYHLTDCRQGGGFVTLLTANIKREEILDPRSGFDVRTLGRIRDQGAILEIEDRDYRERKSA